jgi:hypothetical protein
MEGFSIVLGIVGSVFCLAMLMFKLAGQNK